MSDFQPAPRRSATAVIESTVLIPRPQAVPAPRWTICTSYLNTVVLLCARTTAETEAPRLTRISRPYLYDMTAGSTPAAEPQHAAETRERPSEKQPSAVPPKPTKPPKVATPADHTAEGEDRPDTVEDVEDWLTAARRKLRPAQDGQQATPRPSLRARWPEELKPTPHHVGNGWHVPRLKWVLNWLGPATIGQGFGALSWETNFLQHTGLVRIYGSVIVPGWDILPATFIGSGLLLALTTRRWYRPLAWVMRVPFATSVIAVALAATSLTP